MAAIANARVRRLLRRLARPPPESGAAPSQRAPSDRGPGAYHPTLAAGPSAPNGGDRSGGGGADSAGAGEVAGPGIPSTGPGIPSDGPGIPSAGPGIPNDGPGIPDTWPGIPDAGPRIPFRGWTERQKRLLVAIPTVFDLIATALMCTGLLYITVSV
eukprot:5785928-Pyramimonas_sp.AAC.1